jgi:hypothetical protein
MKQPLAIQLEFDIKTVRRSLALITGEYMTDEEIKVNFFDRECVKIDAEQNIGEAESFQLCAAFLALILDEKKHNENPKKSKLQERIDQIIAKSKNN